MRKLLPWLPRAVMACHDERVYLFMFDFIMCMELFLEIFEAAAVGHRGAPRGPILFLPNKARNNMS